MRKSKIITQHNDNAAARAVCAAGSRSRSHAHPEKLCDSFNQLDKKFVARLVALLANEGA